MSRSAALPSVAAITINFGSPDDTFACVESLLATGYQPLRIIVIDNGSAGAHLTRLREGLPAGVELIESPRNLGFAGGNNLGIRRALDSGVDYVLLINNDATLRQEALATLVATAETASQLGVVGGKILIATEQGPTGEIWAAGGSWSPLRAQGYNAGLAEVDRGQFDRQTDEEFIPACLWLMPARVLQDVGLLREEFFLYTEDLDYCLELRRRGLRIIYEPRAVCLHKVSRSHWQDRERASPVLNYYTNRNRIFIARKWLSGSQRLVFYPYLILSRIYFAVMRRDTSFLAGLWDGFRGVVGPMPNGVKRN